MAFGDSIENRSPAASQQTVRVLAKTLFKEMKRSGYSRAEMVSLASEILEMVTSEFQPGPQERQVGRGA